jgi:hypothetical protein
MFLSMSSLRARVEEQLQLCSKFLVSNDVLLKIIDLLVKVEEDRSNLKLLLQKIGLKENLQKPKLKIKVEQVKRESPTPKVVLQNLDWKIKVKHVKE